MSWPSEIPWATPGLPDMPWPSETWDDPHFGRGGAAADAARAATEAADKKAEAGRLARQGRAGKQTLAREQGEQRDREQVARDAVPVETFQQQTARQTSENTERQQLETERQQQVAARQLQQQQQARRAQQQQQQARNQAASRPGPQASRPQQAAPAPKPSAPAAPSSQGMTKDQVEALIADVGLAGTVQEVMKRTGADFRTAAQLLAKLRAGQ